MANSQYSERVIEGMQMLFGEGFLSPGGAPEVDEMLAGETVTGRTVGPPLFESLQLLGREITLSRIDAAITRLGSDAT